MTYMKGYEKLETCDEPLREIFIDVSMQIPIQIIYGHRSQQAQFELYKKGRTKVNAIWVVNEPSKIVTNCDGFIKKSKHNFFLSEAVDVAPLPIDWNNIDAFVRLSHKALEIANKKGIDIIWGGEFKSKDYCHYERARMETSNVKFA